MISGDSMKLHLDEQTAAVIKKKGYVMGDLLGSGEFGQVYKGRKTDLDVAIKVTDLSKMSDALEKKHFPRILETLRQIEHEHIVTLHDIIVLADQYVFTFMEFAENRDVNAYLEEYGPCDEHLSGFWFGQLSDALSFLHNELHTGHRDIKAENALLTNGNRTVKLADFCFAIQCWDGELSSIYCGTLMYKSYQLIAKVPYSPFAADCHALGVTLFVMLNGHCLFPFSWKSSPQGILEEMTTRSYKKKYTKMLSAEVQDLVDRLLEVKEEHRLKMSAVLEHPWVVQKGRIKKKATKA